MLTHKVKPPLVYPLSPLPTPPAVMATSYKSVADKMLFDPSRNPDVPIPPPPAPPPPVPTPPLPVYHGYMNIGSLGPMAILSINAGAPHVGVHPGEKIGDFTLVSIDPQEITLQWQDRVIRKSTDELANHLPVPEQAAAARAEAPAPVAAPPPVPVAAGPPQGEDNLFGVKPCAPHDSYPEGAVVDGYRKVLRKNPFGTTCLWEHAR